MYRPRFAFNYDNRRPMQGMYQIPMVIPGAQFAPVGMNQYPGSYEQQRQVQYSQRPIIQTVQQGQDIRELIRQDIFHQLQYGNQPQIPLSEQQIGTGQVFTNNSGQKGSHRKRRQDTRYQESPKRTKTSHEGPNPSLAVALKTRPEIYKSPIPSPNVQISEAIIQYYIKHHQTEDCYKKKVQLRDALFSIVQGVFPNSGLYIVGSSMTGFSTMKSDMDICLMISKKSIDQKKEAPELLYMIQRAFRKCYFLTSSEVIRAKVPILRFTDTVSHVECDLNINNAVGIRNTHLLKHYCMYVQAGYTVLLTALVNILLYIFMVKTIKVDWRVRLLVLFVKHWARFHDINDARKLTISSYSLGLMILHYLQSCSPPVLPSLQKLHRDKFDANLDITSLRLDYKIDFKSENTESVGDLFLGFLQYYAKEFDFDHDAISVRLGTKVPIKQLEVSSPQKHQWKCLCIEEPFDLTNTARSCFDALTFNRVKRVFSVSYKVLNKKRDVDELFKAPF